MTVQIQTMPLPARRALSNAGSSKYDLGALQAGSDQCIIIDDVVNTKKAVSRLTSAVAAYKKRTNPNARFAVRSFKKEDGTDAVGVWRLADAVPAADAEQVA